MNTICTPMVSAVLIFGLFAAPAVLAQEDCEAYVNATLERSEQGEMTQLEFDVEVSSSESCAHIEYQIVLEVQLSDGESKQERISRTVKLNDGGYDDVVQHELASGVELVSHDAEIVSCNKCTIMP